ncbi:hypothetical protein D9757_007122 [Collybiopsis confluens]|uniref:Uncharacterized protein n=1 Tax=Collybiopsis confluens TaxID=2823264 RepID=A0A8H5HCN5_9AGAR|nr:hypothetical protein D9757_007122 [Collybiopsis confluens]
MGSFLWFFLGAGAATWYSKHHDRQWGSHQWGHRWNDRCDNHGPASQAAPSDAPPQTPVNVNSSASSPSSSSAPFQGAGSTAAPASDPWATEKERMREIGAQVGVNVLEFSESTLDTLLSSIQNMKAKVVQQRFEREKLEAEQKRLAEEQRMNPPRYV